MDSDILSLGDDLLVVRAQAGNRHAFNLLVLRYQGRILRLVSRLVRNPSEVEDIVQDTFIKAFRALQGFLGDSQFYIWLYRIAINLSKTVWRSYGMRETTFDAVDPSLTLEMSQANHASREDTPEATLIGKQTVEAVNHAVEMLPFDSKAALVLREIDGLSYDEIAFVLMCPVGVIHSRIFRARESIANHLKDCGHYIQ